MSLDLNSKAKENLKSLFAYFIVAGVSLAIILWLFRAHTDWNIPFVTGGDVTWTSAAIKNFINGGDRYFFANLGAPFEVYRFATPTLSYMVLGFAKFATFFSQSHGFVFNIVSVLNFPLTAVVALFALRKLNISRIIGVMCAIIYACLPFAFIRFGGHFSVAFYFMSPLICVSAIWLMQGAFIKEGEFLPQTKMQRIFGNIDKKKMIFGIVVAALIGLCDSYYGVFAMITLFFAGVFAFVKYKSYKHFTAALIMILFVLATTCIWIIISKASNAGHNPSDTRTIGEVENFGLKLTHMLFPPVNSRIPGLYDFYVNYIKNTPLNTENASATLGIPAAIGFLVSLFIALFGKFTKQDKNIEYCGKINIFLVLYGTVGGFSAIINFLFPVLGFARCYNRISVVIAFFSLLALAYLLMRLQLKINKKSGKALFCVAIAAFTAVSLYIQVPKMSYVDEVRNQQYIQTEDYFAEVEASMPSNSSLLLLPHISSEHHRLVENQPFVYDSLLPYLYTKDTKISFGTPANSYEEMWVEQLSNMQTDDMVHTAALAGFSGILVDRLAYNEEVYPKLESELTAATAQEPFVSPDNRYSFFNLDKYIKENLGIYTEQQLTEMKEDVLDGVVVFAGDGFEKMEAIKVSEQPSFRWAHDYATLEIISKSQDVKKARLSFVVSSHSAEFYELRVIYMDEVFTFNINSENQIIEIDINVPQGESIVELYTDVPRIDSSIDERNLRYKLSDLKITELKE